MKGGADMFTYDGQSYDVKVTKVKRSFAKLSTDKSGRLQSGEMFIDLIGVFYNYSISVNCELGKEAEYDRFWEDISAPKPFVSVSFPYNQTELNFDAYVTTGDQDLIRILKNPKTVLGKLTRNIWGPTTLNFTAKKPQRRPL